MVPLLLLLACAHEQTPTCQQYVACVQALDEAWDRDTDLARYQPEGACWGGTAEGQRTCDVACERGLDWLGTHVADLPEACR